MRRASFVLVLVCVALGHPELPRAAEIFGRVTAVAGGEVQILVSGNLLPRPGDAARIFTMVTGVGETPLAGSWSVLKVSAVTVVVVAAVGTKSVPKAGDTVRFDSSQPQSRSDLVRPDGTGASRPPGQEDTAAEPGASSGADGRAGRPEIVISLDEYMMDEDEDLPRPDQIDMKHPQAARVYEKSCNGGVILDCARLAVLLELGRGGATADPARASTLFERACDADIWLACRDLASLYMRGKGVMKNVERAAELRRRSCDGGDPEGCDLVWQYYAAAGEILYLKKEKIKDFFQFAGLAFGDRVGKVHKLLGNPDRIVEHDLDGTLGLRMMYRTSGADDLWVIYEQRTDRVRVIGFECTALPWLESRGLRDPKMSQLCSHRSTILARWGEPQVRHDDGQTLIYALPGDRGSLRVGCRDNHLNICDLVELQRWHD